LLAHISFNGIWQLLTVTQMGSLFNRMARRRYTVSVPPFSVSCVQLTLATREQKHVALKICRSDRETCETAAAEIAVLEYIRWEGECHGNLVRLIETFSIPAKGSARSSHTCIVFELLGPNLLTFLEAHITDVRNGGKSQRGEGGGLPLALVQEFAKQLLCGTSYLHDFCRHIHTDLKVCIHLTLRKRF
jgi:serine/threonine-protein kinase SRPK3